MEALKQLEQAQRAIQLLQSHGVISSSFSPVVESQQKSDSDRFLINFILFLGQPCGELDMEKKCQLINVNLPKISNVYCQEAMPCSSEEGISKHENGLRSLKSDHQDVAMVGLAAMKDANSTLEDFCRSYFMFHDMDVKNPESIFRFLPLLSFTESYIYQLDRLNEKVLELPDEGAANFERDLHLGSHERWVIRFMEQFRANPFRPLALLLEHHGVMTERIAEEFRYGEEYWALERKLCSALARNEKILVEEVMRAIHLKSFDYRVLNLLLYQLRGEEVNELYMQFLSVSEFLVELSDDLFDYEDDVLENTFNVLRMFVRIYGASVAKTKLAKCITEAEEKYELLLRTLDPQLAKKYQRRCEEATREGGKISGPLGTWIIPMVIEDEDSYRSKLSKVE